MLVDGTELGLGKMLEPLPDSPLPDGGGGRELPPARPATSVVGRTPERRTAAPAGASASAPTLAQIVADAALPPDYVGRIAAQMGGQANAQPSEEGRLAVGDGTGRGEATSLRCSVDELCEFGKRAKLPLGHRLKLRCSFERAARPPAKP